MQRGAIEQLAHQAVSEELTHLLASADVQAGEFHAGCLLIKKKVHCRPLRGPACMKLKLHHISWCHCNYSIVSTSHFTCACYAIDL